MLCREVTSKPLQCPNASKRSDQGARYQGLAERLIKFNELNDLPKDLNLNRLDDVSGMQSTLTANKAKWHKFCFLKFNATKLKRAEKRKISQDAPASAPVTTTFTRFSGQHTKDSELSPKELCFFCDTKSTNSLHAAATYGLDRRVRKCAHALQVNNC